MTASTQRQRVLIVAYAFPPTGGVGVQRVTKFVKYLPRFGWDVSVLTPSNPSVPLLDSSWSADVPADALICRARTFEPPYAVKDLISGARGARDARAAWMPSGARHVLRGIASRVLQPDPQVLWFPAAVREGRRLLHSVPHAAILATAPPFSCLLIGAALQRASGLPLVLDYRDEWDLASRFQENKRFGPVVRRLNRSIERRIVRRACAILATTDASARSLEAIRDRAGGQALVRRIRNGFDPDDFARTGPVPGAEPRSRYRVTYTGTLWNLASVRPLVEAIDRLGRQAPGLAARLEVVLAGRRTADQEALLARLSGLPVEVVRHPYLPHAAIVDLMRAADLLCLLKTTVPGAERSVNAKVFEYMAARRPILAIAPRGELWQVLDDYPSVDRFEPADVDGISAFLARRLAAFDAATVAPAIEWDGARYDRRHQAKELADVLASVSPVGD
jgi:glycosyltransferase involved in cell wall biosynthesis